MIKSKLLKQSLRTRVRSFELSRSTDSTFAAPAERKRAKEPTLEAVAQMFPTKLISTLPEEREKVEGVVRDYLIPLTLQDAPGPEAIGRFQRIPRTELLTLFPEGLAGELSRDLILSKGDLGLMIRRETLTVLDRMKNIKSQEPQSNRPILLDGPRGVGKSAILSHVVAHARSDGWLVIHEPLPGRFCRDIGPIKRSSAGIFFQNEFAVSFLERAAIANRQFFEEIEIDKVIYGKTALDGNSSFWVKRVWRDLVEKAAAEELNEANSTAQKDRVAKISELTNKISLPSMASRLPDPKNLWEIVSFGIENEAFATQTVYELFAQLRRQKKFRVLFAVDEFNETLPVSQYVSSKYDDTRFNGYIPGYHLAMARLFSRPQYFANGLSLFATSWRCRLRRDFRPEFLNFRPSDLIDVSAFSPAEFANYVAHYHKLKIIQDFPQDRLDYFYMLTQGNGFQARRALITLY